MEKVLKEDEVKEVQGGAEESVRSAETEEEIRRILDEEKIRLSDSDLAEGGRLVYGSDCSSCSNPRKYVKVLA